MESIPFSPIRKVFEEVGQLESLGNHIINLGIGRPDFDTPQNIKSATIRSLEDGNVHYTSNYGLAELRRAVAAFEGDRLGRRLSEDNVLITVGANEAVFLVMMAYSEPGDEVLIPSPSWFHYDYCATLAGANVVHYPLKEDRGFIPDPEDIESLISERTRILVINSPSNPTGAVTPEEIVREIYDLGRANDILVLSDEIYSQLTYSGHRHFSPLSLTGDIDTSDSNVVMVSGLSKAYSMTGWRLGYVVAPAIILDSLVRVHQYTVTCANSFAQEGAIAAFTASGAAEVRRNLAEFERRRDIVLERVGDLAGWRATDPGGAFYVFANVSESSSGSAADPGKEVAHRLLHEAGVAVVPGSAFSSKATDYVRISYASSEEDLIEAFRRIESLTRASA